MRAAIIILLVFGMAVFAPALLVAQTGSSTPALNIYVIDVEGGNLPAPLRRIRVEQAWRVEQPGKRAHMRVVQVVPAAMKLCLEAIRFKRHA